MKKSHIIGIVLIAVAIATIIGSISDSSTYADFDKAFGNIGKSYHVVGLLNKEEPREYNPEVNADLFKFHMIDNNGMSKPVVLYKSKPQDFERSEQIVLIGQAKEDGAFHATDILLKCPSKYEDGTPGAVAQNEI